MKAVFDTNILIDYLNGNPQAKAEIEQFEKPLISLITHIEILVGAKTKADEQQLRNFLRHFTICEVTPEIADFTVKLRQQHRLRIPDAIIWATALVHECQLVTRNTRDFNMAHPSIRIPYQL